MHPPFSICLCPDSKLLQNRIHTLLTANPPESGGMGIQSAWQSYIFWGDEGIVPAFWEHLTLQGLFASPKALIIRNANNLNAEALKGLSVALLPLARLSKQNGKTVATLSNPLVWPILCFEGAFEKGTPKTAAHIKNLPCFKLAEEQRWIDITPGLTPASTPAYIRTESARLNLVLSQAEVSTLAEGLTQDASLISSELEKLSLLAGKDGRLQAKVAANSTQIQELEFFDILRSIQYNKAPYLVWRRILKDRLSGENIVFGFIAVLLREARTLWQISAGSNPYLSPAMLASKKSMAQSLGFTRIAKIWDLALQADKGIKSGERSVEQAFEILAADLFLLFHEKY